MSVVWEIAALVQFVANYIVVSVHAHTHTHTHTHTCTRTHTSVTSVFELYMLIWIVNTLQSKNTINTNTRTHTLSHTQTHTSQKPTHPYHTNILPSTPLRHKRIMSLCLFLSRARALYLSLTHTHIHTHTRTHTHRITTAICALPPSCL